MTNQVTSFQLSKFCFSLGVCLLFMIVTEVFQSFYRLFNGQSGSLLESESEEPDMAITDIFLHPFYDFDCSNF